MTLDPDRPPPYDPYDAPPDLFEQAGVPQPPTKRMLAAAAVGVIVVVAAVFATWYIASDQAADRSDRARLSRLEEGIETRDETITDLVDNYEALQDELAARGIESPTPPADDIVDSELRVPAPDGPTATQVAAAVADYCSVGDRCRGADGKSLSPSPTEVAAAVASYCSSGACTGARGEAGDPGASVTTTQIAAAVSDYCSTGACTGPVGPAGETGTQGPQGEPGAAGRGITTIACDDGDQLVVTYTDGTSEAVDGATACTGGPPVSVPPA